MIEPEVNARPQDKFAQANPNPVLSSDPEGMLQFVNPAALKLMANFELDKVDNLLPIGHKGLVQACLKTGITLTDESQLDGRNIVWFYQSADEDDVVFIYGHEVTSYMSQTSSIPQTSSISSLLEKNPNPVLSYSAEGVLQFKNVASSLLLEKLRLDDVDAILPINHEKLAEYCFKTGASVTQERQVKEHCIVWSYRMTECSGDLCIYGYDVTELESNSHIANNLPGINPSPVLTTDSEGEPQFINNAVSQLLLDHQLESAEDVLPENHRGLVKACLLTNTPLKENHSVNDRTLTWSYLPVDGSDVIYIYGHDITDYSLNEAGE